MLVTLDAPSRWASSAALYPVPVPISNTRIPGSTSSAVSICATTAGIDAELVTSHPASPSVGRPSSTWVITEQFA